jgi:hypothetical protein
MTVSDQPFKPMLNTVLYEQLQRQIRIEAIEETDLFDFAIVIGLVPC